MERLVPEGSLKRKRKTVSKPATVTRVDQSEFIFTESTSFIINIVKDEFNTRKARTG